MPRRGGGPPVPLRATVGLWTLLFLGVLVVHQIAGNTNHGDTPLLIEGSRTLHGCLTDMSSWGSCDFGIFAPLQYVPALLLVDLGLTNEQIFDGLAGINTVALIGSVFLAWRLFHDRPRLAALAVLTILSGPLLWYSGTSYAEGLTPLILLWLIYVGANDGHPAIVALAAGVAVISKDTAAPFVIAIGLVAILALRQPAALRSRRLQVSGVLAGTLAGLTVLALSNLLRWGSVVNQAYADRQYRMPAGQVPSAFAGLWASPNGGLVVFWPLAVALLVGTSLVAAIRIAKAPRNVRVWWAPALVACAAIASQALLAAWWAPFGWNAWGPRLSLPTIVALAILAIGVCAGPFLGALDFLRGKWPLALLAGGVVVVLAMPTLGAVIRPFVRDFPPNPTYCPPSAAIWTDRPGYFRCLSYATWHMRPIGLTAVQALWSSVAAVGFGLLYIASLSTLIRRAIWGLPGNDDRLTPQ